MIYSQLPSPRTVIIKNVFKTGLHWFLGYLAFLYLYMHGKYGLPLISFGFYILLIDSIRLSDTLDRYPVNRSSSSLVYLNYCIMAIPLVVCLKYSDMSLLFGNRYSGLFIILTGCVWGFFLSTYENRLWAQIRIELNRLSKDAKKLQEAIDKYTLSNNTLPNKLDDLLTSYLPSLPIIDLQQYDLSGFKITSLNNSFMYLKLQSNKSQEDKFPYLLGIILEIRETKYNFFYMPGITEYNFVNLSNLHNINLSVSPNTS